MPYVEGDSLRQRLARGPLEISEAIGILRDVARALVYAHSHNVIHRDIKPDNVLLSTGSATVTDFGIAKALTAARSAGDIAFHTALTVAGTSIGTPTYMAPEQAAGDPHSDHRADIYSFGVMAYEMLCGHPPFHGPPARVLAAHLAEPPKDIRTLRPDCPESLAQLVMQCLAKEPLSRLQMASDVARLLDTISSSGARAAAPAILAGGRIRFARALALWGGATALVALTAWAATEVVGLPDWVFPGSLAVMLAGIPVIVTTWWVQRVVHRTYTATPQFTPGGNTATRPQGTMATFAIKASPHISWRRTWLGGAVAVGGFAALVLTFMVMRAMGVGPFGSLRGSGALGARETLVIADFRSPPNDSTLGATVAEALRTDLAQSQAFQVLTRANLREILRLMRRPTESTVEFDLAREIATREGAKAVLDGSIERLGSSYVVSARLVSSLDGSDLKTFREEARSEDALLEALGRITRDVRSEAGESFKSIRNSSAMERVTTPSLAALRKYVEGSITADERGDSDRGLALLQEAVTIDTAFAMAWRKIAVLLGNEGRERSRALKAVETAFRHRDRLSETERYLTEGYYYTRGPYPDRHKAITAYEAAIRLDSLNTSAINNAAVVYGQMRELDKAMDLYRRVTRLPRSFGGAFTNLLEMQVATRQVAALDSTRDAFRARYPGSRDLWEADWYVAFGSGDLVSADSIARAARTDARTLRAAQNSANALGTTAELRGRPREALRWYGVARDAEFRAIPSPSIRLAAVLDSAFMLSGALGRQAEARALIARALTQQPLSGIATEERPWFELGQLAARMRDPELARLVESGASESLIPQAADSSGTRAWFSAHRAMAEGRYADALPLLQEAERRFAINWRYSQAMMPQVFDLTDQPDSAIAYFEKYHAMLSANGTVDNDYLAGSYKRLGELYESRGDVEKAIARLEVFAEMWKNAEPELQPIVREVNTKLERLRARRGG